MGNTMEILLTSLVRPELMELMKMINEMSSDELKGMLYFAQGFQLAKNSVYRTKNEK